MGHEFSYFTVPVDGSTVDHHELDCWRPVTDQDFAGRRCGPGYMVRDRRTGLRAKSAQGSQGLFRSGSRDLDGLRRLGSEKRTISDARDRSRFDACIAFLRVDLSIRDTKPYEQKSDLR